jgi:hypothetical protein
MKQGGGAASSTKQLLQQQQLIQLILGNCEKQQRQHLRRMDSEKRAEYLTELSKINFLKKLSDLLGLGEKDVDESYQFLFEFLERVPKTYPLLYSLKTVLLGSNDHNKYDLTYFSKLLLNLLQFFNDPPSQAHDEFQTEIINFCRELFKKKSVGKTASRLQAIQHIIHHHETKKLYASLPADLFTLERLSLVERMMENDTPSCAFLQDVLFDLDTFHQQKEAMITILFSKKLDLLFRIVDVITSDPARFLHNCCRIMNEVDLKLLKMDEDRKLQFFLDFMKQRKKQQRIDEKSIYEQFLQQWINCVVPNKVDRLRRTHLHKFGKKLLEEEIMKKHLTTPPPPQKPQQATLTSPSPLVYTEAQIVSLLFPQFEKYFVEQAFQETQLQQLHPENSGLYCPISEDILREPVKIKGGSDHYYQKKSILQWFKKKQQQKMPYTDPMTNQVLKEKAIQDAKQDSLIMRKLKMLQKLLGDRDKTQKAMLQKDQTQHDENDETLRRYFTLYNFGLRTFWTIVTRGTSVDTEKKNLKKLSECIDACINNIKGNHNEEFYEKIRTRKLNGGQRKQQVKTRATHTRLGNTNLSGSVREAYQFMMERQEHNQEQNPTTEQGDKKTKKKKKGGGGGGGTTTRPRPVIDDDQQVD